MAYQVDETIWPEHFGYIAPPNPHPMGKNPSFRSPVFTYHVPVCSELIQPLARARLEGLLWHLSRHDFLQELTISHPRTLPLLLRGAATVLEQGPSVRLLYIRDGSNRDALLKVTRRMLELALLEFARLEATESARENETTGAHGHNDEMAHRTIR